MRHLSPRIRAFAQPSPFRVRIGSVLPNTFYAKITHPSADALVPRNVLAAGHPLRRRCAGARRACRCRHRLRRRSFGTSCSSGAMRRHPAFFYRCCRLLPPPSPARRFPGPQIGGPRGHGVEHSVTMACNNGGALTGLWRWASTSLWRGWSCRAATASRQRPRLRRL
jgi:hypothetical protein